jgi:hypothetical protein
MANTHDKVKKNGRTGNPSDPETTPNAPSLAGPLLVYGAYGKTGRMVAKTALERGHEVVLSGNDRGRLDRLSAEMGGRSARASPDDPLSYVPLSRSSP